MSSRSRQIGLGRVEVTGGFLLLAAALYYLDDQGILLWAALACAIHELGHVLAIYALGGRVSRLRVSLSGAEMALSAAHPLGPGGHCLAALAGPVSNLAVAMLSARMGENWFLFAGLNLGVAAFNLLPMAQLDGGRALYYLIALLWSTLAASRVTDILSRVMSLLLLLAGGVLLWVTRVNFTLLVTALCLAASLKKTKMGMA